MERRKYPRVTVEVEAEGIPEGTTLRPWTARVVEMTVEGLTLKTARPLKPGTECALRFEKGPRFLGTVVHASKKSDTAHIGIRLAGLAPIDRLKLLRYIQDHKI